MSDLTQEIAAADTFIDRSEIMRHYRRMDHLAALFGAICFFPTIVFRDFHRARIMPWTAWSVAWNLNKDLWFTQALHRACRARGFIEKDGTAFVPCGVYFWDGTSR